MSSVWKGTFFLRSILPFLIQKCLFLQNKLTRWNVTVILYWIGHRMMMTLVEITIQNRVLTWRHCFIPTVWRGTFFLRTILPFFIKQCLLPQNKLTRWDVTIILYLLTLQFRTGCSHGSMASSTDEYKDEKWPLLDPVLSFEYKWSAGANPPFHWIMVQWRWWWWWQPYIKKRKGREQRLWAGTSKAPVSFPSTHWSQPWQLWSV